MKDKKRTKDILFKSIIISFICIALFQITNFVNLVSPVKLKPVENDVFEVKNLKPNERYYITVGRALAVCDIFFNDNLVSTNRNNFSNFRYGLYLGGEVISSTENILKINCLSKEGFKFKHKPIVYPYYFGQLLQGWRVFVDVFLTPISTFVLIVISLVFFLYFKRRLSTEEDSIRNLESFSKSLFAFSLIFMTYSLSLSRINRMFLGEELGDYLHILFRHLIVIGFFGVLNSINKLKILIKIELLLGGSFLFSGLLMVTDKKLMLMVYPYQLILFSISCFLVGLSLIEKNKDNYGLISHRMAILNFSWSITVFVDFSSWLLGINFFSTPIISAYIVLEFSRIIVDEFLRRDKVLYLNSLIKEKLKKQDVDIELFFKNLSSTLSTKFDVNVSFYIDKFVSGESEEKYSKYKNIESGEEIDKSILSNIGNSNNIVKLNDFILMDFDFTHTNYNSYLKAQEVVSRLKNGLADIDLVLEKYIYESNIALSKLKKHYSFGNHNVFAGTLFIDIADYSKHTEAFGENYSKFISKVYFPSLLKYLSSHFIKEWSKGDELYLVCIGKKDESEVDVSNRVSEGLDKVFDFINNEGASLCINNGFPSVEFSGGCQLGVINLNVSKGEVTTSGDLVNQAKRYQDVAKKGEILISGSLAQKNSLKGSIIDSQKVIIKKNILNAYRYHFMDEKWAS